MIVQTLYQESLLFTITPTTFQYVLAKKLISYLLTLDPAHRYTASEVTSHPWTLGREDAESAPNQPNVLAMMKDYAKEMANSIEERVQFGFLFLGLCIARIQRTT